MPKTTALTVKIELDFPVDFNGSEVTELNMRRPRVKDRLAVDKIPDLDNATKEVMLIANLCEITPELLHELTMSDYKEVQDKFSDFLS